MGSIDQLNNPAVKKALGVDVADWSKFPCSSGQIIVPGNGDNAPLLLNADNIRIHTNSLVDGNPTRGGIEFANNINTGSIQHGRLWLSQTGVLMWNDKEIQLNS